MDASYIKQIGCYLGSDFNLWHFRITKWFSESYRINLLLEFLRRREGEQDYGEPFPTAVIKKTESFEIGLVFKPSIKVNLPISITNDYYNKLKP